MKDVKKEEHSSIAAGIAGTTTLQKKFLRKLEIFQPEDQAIPLLGIYPKYITT